MKCRSAIDFCSVDLLPFGILKGLLGQRCMVDVAHIYDSEDKSGLTVVTTDEHDETNIIMQFT